PPLPPLLLYPPLTLSWKPTARTVPRGCQATQRAGQPSLTHLIILRCLIDQMRSVESSPTVAIMSLYSGWVATPHSSPPKCECSSTSTVAFETSKLRDSSCAPCAPPPT